MKKPNKKRPKNRENDLSLPRGLRVNEIALNIEILMRNSNRCQRLHIDRHPTSTFPSLLSILIAKIDNNEPTVNIFQIDFFLFIRMRKEIQVKAS